MPAQQQHWIRTAFLSGATGPVAVGTCLVSNGTRYVVATAANRALYGRTEAIALSAGDDDDTAIEVQSTGAVDADALSLGSGDASWVRVDANGQAERVPVDEIGEDDDLIGRCNPAGRLALQPGTWSGSNFTGGSGVAGSHDINSANSRVLGLSGVLFKTRDGEAAEDETEPPVGGTWSYNEVNSVAGFRAKKPSPPGHFDVTNYGAIPDWGSGRTGSVTNGSDTITGVSPDPRTGLRVGQKIVMQSVPGSHEIESMTADTITLTAAVGASSTGGWIVTDNLDAFDAAMDAIRNDTSIINKASKIIADGAFYLSDTWHIYDTVVVEGTGAVYYSASYASPADISYSGTLLVFPADTTGVFIHSGAETGIDHFADFVVMRDLNLACHDAATTSGHGIETRNRCSLKNIVIQAFGGDGIHVEANALAGTGNASGFYFEKCVVGVCKGHGFNIVGGDANIGTIVACEAVNNTGYGFRDASGLGTVYVGCHGEGNDGDVDATVDLPGYTTGGAGGTGDGLNHDYYTENPTNCSTFVGCYSEYALNYVQTPGLILGGLGLGGEGGNKPDLLAFVLGPQGIMSGRRLIHRNNRDSTAGYRVTLGADVDDSNVLSFSPTDTNRTETDTLYVRFVDDCFYLAQSAQRLIQMWPIADASPRAWTTLFPNGIIYGYSTESYTWHYAASTPPTLQRDGATPYSYAVGAIVWNTVPTAPRMGWVCTTAGEIGGTAVFADLPPRSGVGTQAMADANQTPAETVYGFRAIRTTGALTADRDLTLPALTDNQAREWIIVNDCSGAFNVVVKMSGGGTTVTIANTKRAVVWVDSGGVTRVTADAS